MSQITKRTIDTVLGQLALMRYFPGNDDHARAALAAMLANMAHNAEQLLWLGQRAPALYRDWPGAGEIRALFCSRWKPRDGIEARSTVYIADESGGGFPREIAAPVAPPMKALPQPEAARLLAEVASWAKGFAAEPVAKPAPVVKPLPPLPAKPITEADILRAQQELMEGRK